MSIIIKQHWAVQTGDKDKTRRGIKEGETYSKQVEVDFFDGRVEMIEDSRHAVAGRDTGIYAVYSASGRKKWRVGDVVPMVPKMYQKSIGYIRIESLAIEHLGDLTESEALAEGILFSPRDEPIGASGLSQPFIYSYEIPGVYSEGYLNAVDAYRSLWELINGKNSWKPDELIWVVGFKYIGTVKP